MEFYDTPGLRYDQGACYGSGFTLQLKGKHMSKVKLGLDTRSDAEVVALTNIIITAMTGNASFPTPNPPLATLTSQRTAATTKSAAYDSLKASSEAGLADRDAAMATLRGSLTLLAAHVENVSGGDRTKIESAGMSVRADRTPPAVPGQIMNLVLTAGDFPGTLDAAWDPRPGSRLNEIQISPDPMTESIWTTMTRGT
jgi:hypothetical protein